MEGTYGIMAKELAMPALTVALLPLRVTLASVLVVVAITGAAIPVRLAGACARRMVFMCLLLVLYTGVCLLAVTFFFEA